MVQKTATVHRITTGDTTAVPPIRTVPKDSAIVRRIERVAAGTMMASMPILVWIIVTCWNFH